MLRQGMAGNWDILFRKSKKRASILAVRDAK